ncbi:MlaE family ABC transporter permease [Salipiger marinus]|uniref:Phospholipid/cholesterol/gamma-HCH transport system permease protein n=1 Tax=Salipiger marinus TaxID=555512 RepID=A0A1G8KUT6_9RHOB|nr:ABC transporter permease [Salipiger marinus]SDI47208.1 phospholipid/cholesterol/gamma-HCH transport system permease protein [Salipiger marinus]
MAADTSREAPLALAGPVTLGTLDETGARLRRAKADVAVDLSAVTALDTAGAWLLASSGRAFGGGDAAQTLLLRTVQDALPAPAKAPRRKMRYRAGDGLASVGMAVGRLLAATGESLGFLGLVMARLSGLLLRPRRLRLTALVHHMQEVGLNAVPIVALMGFLIGVVLAFQGAAQLRQFGAEVFVVDLIAVSILRELGILLTAIIVAGRSASTFTAAIGSMKMREEIDAIRVLGLDPIALLVLPRFLALVIVLPILGFVASLSGLFGGGLMAWIELGITPSQFRTQMLADVSAAQALVGLVKAPVFAAIIALVGCHQGFQVKGDAESLGLRTSRAVVIAIFLVIVMDALFSVFFAVWGI